MINNKPLTLIQVLLHGFIIIILATALEFISDLDNYYLFYYIYHYLINY